jgi:phenylalanyl-tRNA synthetase beta subunit
MLDSSKDEHAAVVEVFLGFKGDVENLLTPFAYRELSFDRETAEYFHPGRSARVLMDGAVVAQFGQIAESVKTQRKLRQDVFLAEIDLKRLHAVGLRTVRCSVPRIQGEGSSSPSAPPPQPFPSDDDSAVFIPLVQDEGSWLPPVLPQQLDPPPQPFTGGDDFAVFTPLGKYPAVERDFSFVFGNEKTFEAMRSSVMGLGIPELTEFRPVDIFRGESIGEGKYSILLRARLQSDERTLRDEQIAAWSAQIIGALTSLGGVQRA